jgi:exopolysaccharide biosynthesis polyprenyl glycosylphosphotransferase
MAEQVMADFLSILLALVSVHWVGGVTGLSRHDGLFFPLPFHAIFQTALGYGFLFTLFAHSEHLYDPAVMPNNGKRRQILAKSMVWSGVLASLARVGTESAAALAAAAPLTFVGMLLWRSAWLQLLTRSITPPTRVQNVLILGATQSGRALASALKREGLHRWEVVGFLDDEEPLGGEVLGRTRDLARVARTRFVDEIILAPPQRREVAQLAAWEARRNHIDVRVGPDLCGFDGTPEDLERIGDIPLLTLQEESIPRVGLLLKRVLDMVCAGAGLIVISPILAFIALAVRLDSPGPVLYRAPRVGFKGRQFDCYKFRTMVVDADLLKEKLRTRNERRGASFKITDDPRITGVGRFLRRYSLDELPQLWNVLRGEMSMVGPRPHPLDDFEQYSMEDLQRLEVIPGITGLWQVTARRDPSFARNVELDREYIEQWSLGQDLRILLKTVAVVLQGTGA